MFIMTFLTCVQSYSQEVLVYNVEGNVYKVINGKEKPILSSDRIEESELVRLSKNATLTVIHSASKKVYTIKKKGTAPLADLINDKQSSFSDITGIYLDFIKSNLLKEKQYKNSYEQTTGNIYRGDDEYDLNFDSIPILNDDSIKMIK